MKAVLKFGTFTPNPTVLQFGVEDGQYDVSSKASSDEGLERRECLLWPTRGSLSFSPFRKLCWSQKGTEIEDLNMTEVHKNIEQDVVEQILSTLPPKSLMRFKCVSKSFVSGVEDIDILPSLSLRTTGSSLHIVGHCNGIICLVPAVSGEVILWNPAIHEFKPLPPQPYLPDSPEIGESFPFEEEQKEGGLCVRPHLSLLYGNLTGEERRKAQEKVTILDESITSMSFPITRLALYKTDYRDKRLKSWEKIAEYTLQYFNYFS
ncbi:hypothetical protein ACLB2K_015194 [Fragaria x ananassa]